MSFLDIALALLAAIVILVAYQLSGIAHQIRRAINLLQSLDEELFRLAQEHNPRYGCCTNCGRRAIVRHVVPRDAELDTDAPDMFYCQRCWWLSGTVKAGDEQKYYKDRLSKEDSAAARAGPG